MKIETNPVTVTFSGPMPVEAKPLRLEAGKSYVNRRGEVVGPLRSGDSDEWPFVGDDGYGYHEDGTFKHDRSESKFDLIREHVHSESQLVAEKGEEEKARESTPENFIWFGQGPLKVEAKTANSNDIYFFRTDEPNMWINGGRGNNANFFYALRAGSEIARKNGLEPGFHCITCGSPTSGKGDGCTKCNGLNPEGQPAPTYPPAESEWPEKPPIVEALIWERVPSDERINFLVYGNPIQLEMGPKVGEFYWITDLSLQHGSPVGDKIVLRAVPARYSYLWDGAILNDDDELSSKKNKITEGWVSAKALKASGKPASDFPEFRARRRIQAPEIKSKQMGEVAIASDGDRSAIGATEHDAREGVREMQERNKRVEANRAPTYPPAESEWPEKPEPPAGHVWERCEESGEGKCIALEWGNPFIGPVWSEGVFWRNCKIVFRAVEVPAQYRELGLYDSPKEGDEVRYKQGDLWLSLDGDYRLTIGDIRLSNPDFRARRRIQAPEPVVEADPWRDMLPDEVVQEGDQVPVYGEWTDAAESLGETVGHWVGKYPKFKARTRRPLVTVDPVSGVTVPEEMLPLPEEPFGYKWVARGYGWQSNKRTRYAFFGSTSKRWYVCGPRINEGNDEFFYLELVDEAPADERKPREGVIRRRSRGKIGGDFPGLKQGEEIRVREILTGKESL